MGRSVQPVLPHAALPPWPQTPPHERRQPEPVSSARAGTAAPCRPRPHQRHRFKQRGIQHLLEIHHWHRAQVVDTPPGAKQEAVLGQALSSLRGLQDATQAGAPAVQLLPPEPQVLARALLSTYHCILEPYKNPCRACAC